MYDTVYINAIEKLPKKVQQQLKEEYPQEMSLIKTFLKNTEYLHNMNDEFVKQNKQKRLFYRNNKINKSDYAFLLSAYVANNFYLSNPIFINKKPFTKITKQKPENFFVYFKPLKIFLTN